MHLSRTISVVLTTLMLMTTEYFCNTSVNAASFGTGTKTKTPGSRSTISYHIQFADDHHRRNHPATLLARSATAVLTGVRCVTSPKLFAKSKCRCRVDSKSVNKAVFKGQMSRNPAATWDGRQTLKTASHWLIKSLVRILPDDKAHTDTGRLPVSRRHQRSMIDAARELQQRQATWSTTHDDVGAMARRRPPLDTDQLAGEDGDENELAAQTTDNSSQLDGWYGDPEVDAQSLVNQVRKDSSTKYFIGKRHRSCNNGLAAG